MFSVRNTVQALTARLLTGGRNAFAFSSLIASFSFSSGVSFFVFRLGLVAGFFAFFVFRFGFLVAVAFPFVGFTAFAAFSCAGFFAAAAFLTSRFTLSVGVVALLVAYERRYPRRVAR